MTYDQAQKILDLVREGHNYPPRIVDFALFITGDFDAYEAHGGPGMDREVQPKSTDRWCSSSPSMVVDNNR